MADQAIEKGAVLPLLAQALGKAAAVQDSCVEPAQGQPELEGEMKTAEEWVAELKLCGCIACNRRHDVQKIINEGIAEGLQVAMKIATSKIQPNPSLTDAGCAANWRTTNIISSIQDEINKLTRGAK